jgi:hypothetical protein
MRYAFPIAAAVVLITTAAASASKHHPRYVRHARAPAAVALAPSSSFAPARMIEARPGVWISSYGCIQDEGYGRWTYCGRDVGINRARGPVSD